MKTLKLLYYSRVTDQENEDETLINFDDLIRRETYFTDQTPNETILEFVNELNETGIVYVDSWKIIEN